MASRLFEEILLLFLSVAICGLAKQVAIKVVEEPTNYGMNFGGYQQQETTDTKTLTMRIPPSNFSGPAHFKRLVGKCFSKVQDSYKYEFCPFKNVSQFEQSLRWNPYSGILGVFQEWEIENNTFVAMIMNEGDSCGSVQRSVKVLFKCSDKSEIGQVTEPHTCQYQMTFFTPLVCHPHAMLVYPMLSQDLRREWDQIETSLVNKEITQKGYKKSLGKIFEKAGFVLNSTMKSDILKKAEHKQEENKKLTEGNFDTLHQCSEEYKKLKAEVTRLQTILENHQIEHNENIIHNNGLPAHKEKLEDDYENYRNAAFNDDSIER